MGDTSAKDPKAISFSDCIGRKVCDGHVWWNKGGHLFMTARRASITRKAAWTSRFAILTEDKLCLFKFEKKEPNEKKVRRYSTKALSLNNYCRVHSDDDVIVTPTSDKRALSVFKLEVRSDVTDANDEYFGVETSEASGEWIESLNDAIKLLNDKRRGHRDVDKKTVEEQHNVSSQQLSQDLTTMQLNSSPPSLATKADERTYDMPHVHIAHDTDTVIRRRPVPDTPQDDTPGNQSSSSTSECDALEYGDFQVGDNLIYQDGTLTQAAMWGGSPKAAVEFIEKHKNHEGLYYIRKSLSGIGHTLVMICNGQPYKLLIEENPNKSVTLFEENFSDLETLLQHFSKNNLPYTAIQLKTPYTRLKLQE